MILSEALRCQELNVRRRCSRADSTIADSVYVTAARDGVAWAFGACSVHLTNLTATDMCAGLI